MSELRYKLGDRVKIKSLDWYNENKNKTGDVPCGEWNFTQWYIPYCGEVMTIRFIWEDDECYKMVNSDLHWTDEMIEGLVEEETKFGTASNPIEIKSNANCLTRERVDALATKIDKELPSGNQNVWELPNGYQFIDENGNVINATKITLEKKHNDKLKLESIKKVREYWSEYARIFIEIYDDEPDECVFTHLWVVSGQRQKGHGKRALMEAEVIAKELGCHAAYLKVETDSWMHHWYLRCGYIWYKNAPDNYTWLTKHL